MADVRFHGEGFWMGVRLFFQVPTVQIGCCRLLLGWCRLQLRNASMFGSIDYSVTCSGVQEEEVYM